MTVPQALLCAAALTSIAVQGESATRSQGYELNLPAAK
jgi:hypothetical protein